MSMYLLLCSKETMKKGHVSHSLSQTHPDNQGSPILNQFSFQSMYQFWCSKETIKQESISHTPQRSPKKVGQNYLVQALGKGNCINVLINNVQSCDKTTWLQRQYVFGILFTLYRKNSSYLIYNVVSILKPLPKANKLAIANERIYFTQNGSLDCHHVFNSQHCCGVDKVMCHVGNIITITQYSIILSFITLLCLSIHIHIHIGIPQGYTLPKDLFSLSQKN